MHFSTTTYLCSVFSLLAIQPGSFASPAPSSYQAVTYRTSANRACHRGTYNSQSSCTINCGSGPSAGNCTKITTLLVNDSPPYDCTCPGDPTALLDNDQSQTQSPSSTSIQQQPPLLRKTRPRWLSAQSLQLQARATHQQQQQKRMLEKPPLKEHHQEQHQLPRAVLMRTPTTTVITATTPPCKRGYHKNMDACMANCGTRSGRCISFQHVDGGSAVACQCKPGEL